MLNALSRVRKNAVRFRILRDALLWSAPQDKVRYFKGVFHPEEAPRTVSKGVDTESRIFPHPVSGWRADGTVKLE